MYDTLSAFISTSLDTLKSYEKGKGSLVRLCGVISNSLGYMQFGFFAECSNIKFKKNFRCGMVRRVITSRGV